MVLQHPFYLPFEGKHRRIVTGQRAGRSKVQAFKVQQKLQPEGLTMRLGYFVKKEAS
jgi:uncharacterized ParB-like nuclease family protein